jgi:hypothetical protein
MRGKVEVFNEKLINLPMMINQYIKNTRENYFINLTPTDIDKTVISGGNNINEMKVHAMVCFSATQCTDDEIRIIKKLREEDARIEDRKSDYILRTNYADNSIVFYCKEDYYDIHELYHISIIADNYIRLDPKYNHIYTESR